MFIRYALTLFVVWLSLGKTFSGVTSRHRLAWPAYVIGMVLTIIDDTWFNGDNAFIGPVGALLAICGLWAIVAKKAVRVSRERKVRKLSEKFAANPVKV